MPFPISINGEVPLPSVPVDDFPERVILACLDELEHERADITDHTRFSVSYHRPLFSIRASAGWWLPVWATTGSFDVQPNATVGAKITYRLSLARSVAIGSVMPVVFLIVPEARWAVIPALAWFLGAPYLFMVFRARHWTRKRIEEAKRIALPEREHR